MHGSRSGGAVLPSVEASSSSSSSSRVPPPPVQSGGLGRLQSAPTGAAAVLSGEILQPPPPPGPVPVQSAAGSLGTVQQMQTGPSGSKRGTHPGRPPGGSFALPQVHQSPTLLASRPQPPHLSPPLKTLYFDPSSSSHPPSLQPLSFASEGEQISEAGSEDMGGRKTTLTAGEGGSGTSRGFRPPPLVRPSSATASPAWSPTKAATSTSQQQSPGGSVRLVHPFPPASGILGGLPAPPAPAGGAAAFPSFSSDPQVPGGEQQERGNGTRAFSAGSIPLTQQQQQQGRPLQSLTVPPPSSSSLSSPVTRARIFSSYSAPSPLPPEGRAPSLQPLEAERSALSACASAEESAAEIVSAGWWDREGVAETFAESSPIAAIPGSTQARPQGAERERAGQEQGGTWGGTKGHSEVPTPPTPTPTPVVGGRIESSNTSAEGLVGVPVPVPAAVVSRDRGLPRQTSVSVQQQRHTATSVSPPSPPPSTNTSTSKSASLPRPPQSSSISSGPAASAAAAAVIPDDETRGKSVLRFPGGCAAEGLAAALTSVPHQPRPVPGGTASEGVVSSRQVARFPSGRVPIVDPPRVPPPSPGGCPAAQGYEGGRGGGSEGGRVVAVPSPEGGAEARGVLGRGGDGDGSGEGDKTESCRSRTAVGGPIASVPSPQAPSSPGAGRRLFSWDVHQEQFAGERERGQPGGNGRFLSRWALGGEGGVRGVDHANPFGTSLLMPPSFSSSAAAAAAGGGGSGDAFVVLQLCRQVSLLHSTLTEQRERILALEKENRELREMLLGRDSERGEGVERGVTELDSKEREKHSPHPTPVSLAVPPLPPSTETRGQNLDVRGAHTARARLVMRSRPDMSSLAAHSASVPASAVSAVPPFSLSPSPGIHLHEHEGGRGRGRGRGFRERERVTPRPLHGDEGAEMAVSAATADTGILEGEGEGFNQQVRGEGIEAEIQAEREAVSQEEAEPLEGGREEEGEMDGFVSSPRQRTMTWSSPTQHETQRMERDQLRAEMGLEDPTADLPFEIESQASTFSVLHKLSGVSAMVPHSHSGWLAMSRTSPTSMRMGAESRDQLLSSSSYDVAPNFLFLISSPSPSPLRDSVEGSRLSRGASPTIPLEGGRGGSPSRTFGEQSNTDSGQGGGEGVVEMSARFQRREMGQGEGRDVREREGETFSSSSVSSRGHAVPDFPHFHWTTGGISGSALDYLQHQTAVPLTVPAAEREREEGMKSLHDTTTHATHTRGPPSVGGPVAAERETRAGTVSAFSDSNAEIDPVEQERSLSYQEFREECEGVTGSGYSNACSTAGSVSLGGHGQGECSTEGGDPVFAPPSRQQQLLQTGSLYHPQRRRASHDWQSLAAAPLSPPPASRGAATSDGRSPPPQVNRSRPVPDLPPPHLSPYPPISPGLCPVSSTPPPPEEEEEDGEGEGGGGGAGLHDSPPTDARILIGSGISAQHHHQHYESSAEQREREQPAVAIRAKASHHPMGPGLHRGVSEGARDGHAPSPSRS
eukprot:Cvel_4447.t2-p1 / transcript=Cvel_4447.t2 / gene=Cvel_4447 / organism=Chromera_velia_CCMP2878 / gene_product=hypothetical protein / transcript_product=hypothetical protein / location=Cvel_scaffold194:14845-19347(-) / protein_length=1501 / sequence_SO=supercontig / SO=protein_coding / is_pseudo=false